MFKRTCDNPGPKQDTEIRTDAWFEKEDTVHLTINESSQMYTWFMFFYRRDEVSKTSIFLCHRIKRWYLPERSIMDTSLNTRFLVASGRSARDALEQEKKNPKASCALSLFLLGGCGAYFGAPNDCFLWNICLENQILSRIFYSLKKAHSCPIFEAYLTNSHHFPKFNFFSHFTSQVKLYS